MQLTTELLHNIPCKLQHKCLHSLLRSLYFTTYLVCIYCRHSPSCLKWYSASLLQVPTSIYGSGVYENKREKPKYHWHFPWIIRNWFLSCDRNTAPPLPQSHNICLLFESFPKDANAVGPFLWRRLLHKVHGHEICQKEYRYTDEIVSDLHLSATTEKLRNEWQTDRSAEPIHWLILFTHFDNEKCTRF